MKTEIWQARTEVPYKFRSFKENLFSPNDYKMVFEGETPGDLDGIYELFNTKPPKEMKGHSLSVSDIICLPDEGKVFYVQTFGFLDITKFLMDKKNVSRFIGS